jgi:hypothetical protein
VGLSELAPCKLGVRVHAPVPLRGAFLQVNAADSRRSARAMLRALSGVKAEDPGTPVAPEFASDGTRASTGATVQELACIIIRGHPGRRQAKRADAPKSHISAARGAVCLPVPRTGSA